MEFKELEASIEAILFASGDPMETSKLSEILEVDKKTLQKIIIGMKEKFDNSNGALTILKLDNKVQLCTKTKHADIIKKVFEIKRNTPLSPAAFEVLAIVAYNQPVTRAFVEQVRGVDSSGVFNSLLAKGLIEERGRLELPGRPLIYGTTANFLRCFMIDSIENLPKIPEKNENNQQENGQAELKSQNIVNNDTDTDE